jgi:hypothetical protein
LLPTFIALMIEAASTSETSLNFYQITGRNNPEDSLLAASIIDLMMEAASTSETSINFYQTTLRENPEDSHLHFRRRQNLKYHKR